MDALPIVQRAYEQRKSKVGEEFESWANSIVQEMDEDDPTEIGGNQVDSFVHDVTADNSDEDIDGNAQDSDTPDETLENLFRERGFEYNFTNGTYWFESKEELERAKDVIAEFDPRMEFPKMGIADPESDNLYGASMNDREFPTSGVHEDADPLNLLKQLSGLTK